jgi:hypothetical protein
VTASRKAGLGEGALFALYPVVAAVAVAVKVVVDVDVEGIVDLKVMCSVEAEHSECWEMTVHGKTIELTSGRWKEIW